MRLFQARTYLPLAQPRKGEVMTALSRLLLAGAALAAVAATLTFEGSATAPPIGPLPKGAVTTITTPVQEYIGIALPRGESGLVWRAAPPYDPSVVRPAAERDIGSLTVLVYRTVKVGKATLRFGLTNDERPKVYRSATYKIVVTPR